MARKDEAATHLMAGKSLRQIASDMGISLQSVAQYLYTKVGEGTVKRSDILFSIEPNTRRLIEDLIQQLGKVESNSIYGAARRQGHQLSYDELAIYLKLRDARVSLGDMYELICRIETELHAAIKITLVEEYGPSEKGWWRQVPKEIRQSCQQMREDDGEPAAEPFCYTTFVQLSKVLDKQWSVFVNVLPVRVAERQKEAH